MIALLLMLLGSASGLPVLITPTPATASVVQSADGLLVGCMFPDEGATKEHATSSGIGIYLPSGKAEGALDESLIRDPEGMLSAGGFNKASTHKASVHFTGANQMTLTAAGGGMFDAHLIVGGSSRTGVCQTASAESREKAFEFFDGFARDMKSNSEGDMK